MTATPAVASLPGKPVDQHYAPGVTASYGYDADGRRVTQSFNGQVTNSLWDEASPYGDVVLETNASGSTLASAKLMFSVCAAGAESVTWRRTLSPSVICEAV